MKTVKNKDKLSLIDSLQFLNKKETLEKFYSMCK